MLCPATARGGIFNDDHFCDQPVDHDGPHTCLCGHVFDTADPAQPPQTARFA